MNSEEDVQFIAEDQLVYIIPSFRIDEPLYLLRVCENFVSPLSPQFSSETSGRFFLIDLFKCRFG